MTSSFSPFVSKVRLAQRLASLRSFLVTDLRAVVTRFGDTTTGTVTLPSSIGSLNIGSGTSNPLTVTITYPASGKVRWEFETTAYPTANDSAILVGLMNSGTIYTLTDLVVAGEAKGRKRCSNLITGVPFSTVTYTMGGAYFGGSGGAFAVNSSSGDPTLVTVTPL